MGKWEEKTIDDVASVKSSKRIFKNEYVTEGVPFYRSKEVGQLHDTGDTYSELFISKSRYNEIKNKFGLPREGDLLLTSVGTIGKTWIVDNRKFYYKDGNLTQLSVYDNFCVEFLQYFFKSPLFLDVVFDKVNGTAYNALTITKIKDLKIPLPPLPEQKRLVSKLDGLFEKIDAAIVLLEENFAHTQALMGSVLDEEFGKLDCKWFKLEDVTTMIGGGTPKTAISEYWSDDIVWLSPTDLPPIGVISKVGDSRKRISKLGLQKSSAKLLPIGTVVFSSRATIGKIAITTRELSTNQGFTNFIPNDDLDKVYLAKTLKQHTPKIEALSNSTTFKEVSKTSLKSFQIPVPGLEVQRKLSKLFSKYQEYIDGIVTFQTKKLEDLKQLKSSLLDQAFKGEL